MQAVKNLIQIKDLDLQHTLWGIKAAIQEYVLRSWSLVKMGTTTARKKLFFNLKNKKSNSSRSRRRFKGSSS